MEETLNAEPRNLGFVMATPGVRGATCSHLVTSHNVPSTRSVPGTTKKQESPAAILRVGTKDYCRKRPRTLICADRGWAQGWGVLPGVLWDVRSVLDRASQGGSYWTHPQGEVRRDAHLKSGHFLPVLGGEGNTKPTPCPSGREGGKGGGCGLSWTERSWGVAAGTSSGQGVRGDPGTKPHGPGETRASLGSLSLQPFPPRSQRPQGPVRCAGAQVPHLLTS